LFSVVSVCAFVCPYVNSVCLFVCLSVNMITPEPLEIPSRNFQVIMNHPTVERADKFENGYCGVRAW